MSPLPPQPQEKQRKKKGKANGNRLYFAGPGKDDLFLAAGTGALATTTLASWDAHTPEILVAYAELVGLLETDVTVPAAA